MDEYRQAGGHVILSATTAGCYETLFFTTSVQGEGVIFPLHAEL